MRHFARFSGMASALLLLAGPAMAGHVGAGVSPHFTGRPAGASSHARTTGEPGFAGRGGRFEGERGRGQSGAGRRLYGAGFGLGYPWFFGGYGDYSDYGDDAYPAAYPYNYPPRVWIPPAYSYGYGPGGRGYPPVRYAPPPRTGPKIIYIENGPARVHRHHRRPFHALAPGGTAGR